MKRIAIIGGGISGLVVLHYLKERFKDTVAITLYERESSVGGTIQTKADQEVLFETGPNGFLNNQSATFDLIEELNLTGQIINANIKAKRRYIQMNGCLYPAPMDPISLIASPLLSVADKFHLFKGLFKKNVSTDQSIYDYVNQRFGHNCAERLADPFISGIFAGNIKRLHMQSAFPKLFSKKKGRTKMCMHSFQNGMSQIIKALAQRYQSHIQTNKEINSIADLKADVTICCTTAFVASQLLEPVNSHLSELLGQIKYSPVAVVGLVFDQGDFQKTPDGYGYLVPSNQGKDVLGVLIESNVFEHRVGNQQMLIRVMLGGAHHPGIINDEPETILNKAIEEINNSYGLKSQPHKTFIKLWPKAIPQYELNYPTIREAIKQELHKTPELYLCANYLDGISFNDCVNNAKTIATTIRL